MKSRTKVLLLIILVLVVGAISLFAAFQISNRETEQSAAEMTGGNPVRGRALIREVGCGSCHTIPGISGADSNVGPPLNKIAGRMFIGGVLENNPDNMIRWLQNPPGVDEKTAMPNLGLSEENSRDVAAYLYTLK
ncbi:c-type cytochrome [soil metagenome]|jgi:cytochrome c2|nr:c-type cytochrome [Acidobacteriota bacterium]